MANNLTSSLLKIGNKKKTNKTEIGGTTSAVPKVEFGSVQNGKILTPSQTKAETKLSAGAISGRQELRDRSTATAVTPSTGLTSGATPEIEQLKNREETPEIEIPKPTEAVTEKVATKVTEPAKPVEPAPTPTETAIEGMKNMGATGGVVDKSTEDTTGSIEGQINASAGLPGVFGAQDLIAQNQELLSENIANNTFDAKERGRRNELIASLNQTTIGQAALSQGGNLAQLTTQQLEDLASSEGIELSDKIKERLQSEGKSFIENYKINKTQNLAQNKYSQSQLNREFGRAITDREEFNAQQDARLRRMVAAFGGGAASSLSNNVAVMREREKGVSILEDLRGQYVDKQSLLSTQAMGVMDSYTNNVNSIESKMSALLEDKYAAITNTVDDLIDQGVTNKEDLNAAVLQAKQDYWKTYADVSEKAQTFITDQNQQLFDNQIKLEDLRIKQDKNQQTNRFADTQGNKFSAPVGDISLDGMQTIPEPITDNAGNCVLYCREKNPALPYGLFTISDKQKAVQDYGFVDPSKVSIGDSVLTSEGDSGHAATVIGIEDGMLILDEANYKSGEVTKGRRLASDSDVVLGFIKPGQQTGTVIGNTKKEGTNKGIMDQVEGDDGITQEETFQPQTELDQLADEFRSGLIDSAELGRQGFNEDEINTIATRAREIEKQFPSAISQLTPAEVLQTKDLSVQIFGKRAGSKIENIDTIAKLKAQGMSNDEIQDQLRLEGFGKEFTGRIKSTFSRLSTKGFTKEQKEANREELEDLASQFGGDSPEVKDFMLGLALDRSDATTRQQVGGRIEALENLKSIDENLKAYVEKNGDTGLLSGNLEKLQENVLKSTGDPELAGIANEIALSIISYRKAVSGAAFTESEAKQYDRVFPDVSKSPELNQAVIDSLSSVFERNNDSFFSVSMGRQNFNELFPNGVSPVIFGEEEPAQQAPATTYTQPEVAQTQASPAFSGEEVQGIRDSIQQLSRSNDAAGLEELAADLAPLGLTINDFIQ